jgi:predicted dehydrogenase
MTGLAFIGTGRWAPQLAAGAQHAGLEVVTCFSRGEQSRRAFAERFGCDSAESLEAAIEHPRVTGVVLATPNDVHAEQALAAAERGRHVFVEKPIADTVEGGQLMRDACARAGVVLMVGHAFRRMGAARRAKELLDAGAIGRPVLAEANLSLPGKLDARAWRSYRARNPGGAIMQLGIHHVDTLASWLGPIRSAGGRFARVATEAEIDDVGVVVSEHDSGALSVVTSSYVSPHLLAVRVQGTGGVLEYRADMGAVWPAADRVDSVSTLTVDGEAEPFAPRDPLTDEMAELARCIEDGSAPETDADGGIAALRAVLDAVRESEAVAR